jgi:cytochrome c-type biogenesis protein CcmH/NrfG
MRRKSIQALLFSLALGFAQPVLANNVDKTDNPEQRIEVLTNRLEEIKAIDRAGLTREDKRELRQEVKQIKGELETQRRGAGIYISGGAILVAIILLLILL